jgi:hypothetical protein
MAITKTVLINIQAVSPVSTFAAAAGTGVGPGSGTALEFWACIALTARIATIAMGNKSIQDVVDRFSVMIMPSFLNSYGIRSAA